MTTKPFLLIVVCCFLMYTTYGQVKFDTLLYGAAYYPENMPYERVDEDIVLMKKAGVNVVRMGESSWSLFEKQDGVFDFKWLDRVVDKLYINNIKVIIGTPTYTIPAWMAKKKPAIIATKLNGEKWYYGVRQNMDLSNKDYLFYAERIVRKVSEHYAKHPGVIGFQLDNETTANQANTTSFFNGFVQYLKQKYKTTDSLNNAWGLNYWSQRIDNWNDFPTRDGTTNPGYKLEWDRYNQKVTSDFLIWQANIVKQYKRSNQFSTHCFNMIWWFPNSSQNQPAIAEHLEVAGLNVYHDTQDKMEGVGIAIGGDFARSFKRNNYLVLETNAQTTGYGSATGQAPPFDGQLRLNAFHHYASGANMVEYWHWHSNHSGNETYWKGILSHDLKPNRVYNEMAQTSADLQKISSHVVNLKRTAKTAILYSSDSYFGLEAMPFGGNYNWELLRAYTQLYKMNVPVDFVFPKTTALNQYELIVVPPLYVTSNDVLIRLTEYVRNGGHIIFWPKAGFCNEYNTVRWTEQPGLLSELCGLTYQEFSSVNKMPLKIDTLANAYADKWAELLQPTTGRALAWYTGSFFEKYPAIVANQFGKGNTIYMGTLLSDNALKKVLEDKCLELNLLDENQLVFPIVHKQGMNAAGKRIDYYLNYSGTPQTFTLHSVNCIDLLSNKLLQKNSTVVLKPWDLMVTIQQ